MTGSQRLAWITGAGKGIGRAVALALAREGWVVAASARTEADLASLGQEARGMAGAIHAFALDVTDAPAVAETVSRIEDEHGPIALAILNAGTHKPMGAADFSIDTMRTLMELNVMGTAHALAPILPRFRARRSGRIAIVASVAGYRGLPTAAAYGPSKSALITLAESLRFDLARDGVVMQLINPGFVRTPLTERNDFPMPFLMSVEDAAERIVRGLKGNAFEITFPRRFTWGLKLLRALPYALYFPLVAWATKQG